MRTRFLPVLLLAACATDAEESAVVLTAPVFEVRTDHFNAHATGAEEVPARDTRAQGEAQFRLSEDGETLHYKLIVANIENILQSHIHRAPQGVNGGIVVWLYNHDTRAVDPIPGRFQGVLAEGDITADDLVNAMAGQELADLLAEIRAGNTYVNVHTTQFPPGEIRLTRCAGASSRRRSWWTRCASASSRVQCAGHARQRRGLSACLSST